ncbi:hypothetical protein CIL06_11710 [Pantoea vagans]|nr:hypothetical protein CIL06_11710 [Pantoea vagans]
MHKQNCTSFNPRIVITYPKNNGKPFLKPWRACAHICQKAHIACSVGFTTAPANKVRGQPAPSPACVARLSPMDTIRN